MKNSGLYLGTNWYSTGILEEVKLYRCIKKINNNYNAIIIPEIFTIWDSIKIQGLLALRQIIEIFKNEYELEIDYINSGNKFFLDLIDDNEEDLNKKIEVLYSSKFNKKLNEKNT